MKKYKVVFVLAIVAALGGSVSGAAGLQVDFDRGVFEQPSFIEALRVSDSAAPAIVAPECVKADHAVTRFTLIHKLSLPYMKELREAISNIPGVSPEFIHAVRDNRVNVLYDDKTVYVVLPVGKDYYTLQESAAEALLASLKEQRSESLRATRQNKSWVVKCRPIVKVIWKWIQDTWVAYEITEEICEHVEVDDTPSGDSTWNPGPGPGAVPPGNPFEQRAKGK